jgi:antitoxin ParD1/3/4
MPSSYTIGEHFEDFIKSQVTTGRYSTASEVIREGLRLLEQRELERLREVEEVRQLIAGSRDDPRPTRPADEVLDRLEAKYRAMLPDATATR